MAIRSAWLLGAERVIAIDSIPERLRMAREMNQAETIDFEKEDVFDRLKTMTGGRGPDACIDAVGLEAHGGTFDSYVDKVKAATFLATDRPNALRQAIFACRKGGTVSTPGVYGGFLDKMPFGAAFQKGLTFKMGQTHMMRLHEAAARSNRARGAPIRRSSSPTVCPSMKRPTAITCSGTSRTSASRWY